MSGSAVTPTGVREGDPAALAALCAVRGPSVYAYCRQVAGDSDAGAAAAEAFARFRMAVVAGGADSSVNPDVLLISATRAAAASRSGADAQGLCAEVPMLLAKRADRSLSIIDLERLDAHLADCWACRAPVARFKAAERAYRDPPEETLPPETAASIVAALASAVPTTDGAQAATPAASVAASNGSAEQGERALDPDATQALEIGEPTVVHRVPGIRSHEIDDEPAKPAGRRAAVLAAAGALAGATRAVAKRRPRPQLALPRALPAMRLSVVAPVALIVGALIVGLVAAGVIGGSDPASSPQVAVPAGEPGVTSAPDVVVVPGAKEASAEAVEVAKARQRALENGQPVPDSTPGPAAAKPAAKPTTSSSAPPPVAPPPPPPPPPASQANAPVETAKRATVRKPEPKPSSSGASTGIDAGSGATGAEQIPSAQDTSSVPDLAPPPQSVPRP